MICTLKFLSLVDVFSSKEFKESSQNTIINNVTSKCEDLSIE